MTTAINANDAALHVEYPEALDDDDFVNALMADVDPEGDDDASKKKPSNNETEANEEHESDNDAEHEPTDEDAEEPSEDDEESEGGEDDENDADEDDKPKRKFADDSDETYVKVKEGDTEHEVKVSDLKRLFGQEAALTRRSQEVAAERETVA